MTSITIPAKGVTFDGLPFAPKNVDPGFSGQYAEFIMWSEDDTVTVEVTDDCVFITTETASTVSQFVSTFTRTTTTYRCPVVLRTCTPDFSVFDNTDTDEYVPSRGVPDYGMFSDEGNLAVAAAVAAALNADNITTVAAVQAAVEGHPEVNDTVVRERIYAELDRCSLIREDS